MFIPQTSILPFDAMRSWYIFDVCGMYLGSAFTPPPATGTV